MTIGQHNKYENTINIIFRVFVYSFILFASMSISTEYFADSYIANLSVFTILLTTYELITTFKGSRIRQFLYIVVVILTLISSLFLLRESIIISKKETLQENREEGRELILDSNGIVLGINEELIIDNYSSDFIIETGFFPFEFLGKHANSVLSPRLVERISNIKKEMLQKDKDWHVYINRYRLKNNRQEFKNYTFQIFALRYTKDKIKGNIQFIVVMTKE